MKRVILFIVILGGAYFAQAQESQVFFYHKGEKIFLNRVENTQMVHFKTTTDTQQRNNLRNQLRGFDYTVSQVTSSIYKVSSNVMQRGGSNVISTMEMNDNVLYVSDMLMYRDSTIQWASNKMFVNVHSASDLREMLQKNNIPFVGFEQFGFNQETYLVELDIFENSAIDYANRLFESGDVVWASPVFGRIIRKHNAHYSQQWGLNSTSQSGDISDIDIRAEQAWGITTGTGIRVAVLDDGVDLNHPSLVTNLLPGYDATDHNRSGSIGVDTKGGASMGDLARCDHHYYWLPICDIGDSHGTSCAGIIAAVNNDIGIKGVAHGAKIIPIRIGYNEYVQWGDSRCQAGTVIFDYWIARAIYKAIELGADVLSNSWGGGSLCPEVYNAINAALTQGRNGKGAVVVFAAGNGGWHEIIYPANLPDVIAVGAITPTGQRADFSNFGTNLDVVAPGVDIFTTYIQGCPDSPLGNYAFFEGTSAAAPHVAGVAALMLSANPYLTWQQVKNIIERTAQRVNPDFYDYEYVDFRPYGGTWNIEMGHGLVDAYAAVKMALATPVVIGPDFITPFGTYTISTGQSAIWSVTPGFILDISPCSTSVTVRPSTFGSVSGTLTAVVDGVTLTKNIRHAFIIGNGVVSAPTNFRLNTNQVAEWSVTPEFRITTINNVGTSVTIAPVNANSFSGIVTATLEDGTTLEKRINTRHNSTMNVGMWLATNRQNSTSNFRATFRAVHTPSGTAFPTERNLITGHFNHSTGYFSNSFQIESGTFFTEAMIFLVGDRIQSERVRYNATVQVFNHHEDEAVHTQHTSGEAFINLIDAYEIRLFEDGWREPYNGNWATMTVSLQVDFLDSPLRSFAENTTEVFIFPNPASGVLNVRIDTEKSDLIYDVRLYDNQGNLLRRSATTDGQVQFNVINLPNGSYFLHVYDNESNTPIKRQVMIER